MNIDRFLIAGRITMPIQLRQDSHGRDATSLPVAVNKRVRKFGTDELHDVVLFVDVSVFGKTARVAKERLTVGSEVVIEGHHQNREIIVEGKKLHTITLIADNVHWPKTPTGKVGA